MYRVFLWIMLSVTSAERDCVTVCLTFVTQGLPNKTSRLHLSGKASPPAGARLASFNATLLSQRVTEKTVSLLYQHPGRPWLTSLNAVTNFPN